MRAVLLTIVLCVLPTPVAAEDLDTPFKWGLVCSVGTDMLDLYSTVYAHEKREDIVEANRVVYGDSFDVGDLTRPLVIKSVGAVVVNGSAYWMKREGLGVWANLLVWGNCIGKGIVATRNFVIANDAPEPPRGVSFFVRLRF